ncbi:glycosyltransferase [Mucilaginibacter endophyticus]|uniref:glycosyltransferase n=1 Tax=Mucilaginibacter endophyticus TaxID=2675003 RepID=UPI000E0CFC68|nr:glycosyltransferase [Mucilaginibacter endophyticus]
MTKPKIEKDDYKTRSNFIREFIQRSNLQSYQPPSSSNEIPKMIIQFWDNFDNLPDDVGACIETWKTTRESGFNHQVFDKQKAGDYILKKLDVRHKLAFDKCYHPAMQSDFFRLCYIFIDGGCYIDVDDKYTGVPINKYFDDCRLKIQPLCYDIATNTMVSPSIFTKQGANNDHWIFYFNNNPLIAKKGNIIVASALKRALLALENNTANELPEIQSTTGPGNLTKTIFDNMLADKTIEDTMFIFHDWENTAKNEWNLSYRNDARNWRHSNGQVYSSRKYQ